MVLSNDRFASFADRFKQLFLMRKNIHKSSNYGTSPSSLRLTLGLITLLISIHRDPLAIGGDLKILLSEIT